MFKWLENLFKTTQPAPQVPIPTEVRSLEIVDLRGKLKTHATKRYKPRTSSISHIAIHHSMTTSGDAYAFARYHVGTNNWPGIGYHYVIDKDGTINWCQDHATKTYHVGFHNNYSLGVCIVGDYRTEKPSDMLWNKTLELIKHLMLKINLADVDMVLGHQEFEGYDWKPCPGQHWDMAAMRKTLDEMV